MDMVMFDLQTAALAAAGSGIPAITAADGSGEDGAASFSEVLAAQADNTAEEISADASESKAPDEGYVIPEEYLPANVPAGFYDVFGLLEKMDFGVQKGLKMLFNTMMKAVMGPDDGKQRKTDLFSMFYDDSASFLGEDEDMFLLTGGIMNNIGNVISMEQENGTEDDEIIEALKEALKRMYGTEDVEEDDEDDDDEIPVDILAALVHSPMSEEELEEYDFMDKSEIVETVKEAFSYPKELVDEIDPEKGVRMEEIFADYRAVILGNTAESSEPEYHHETIRMNFSGMKINNAAEQIETITRVSDPDAEVSAAALMPQFVQTVNEIPEFPQEEIFDVPVEIPVEDQVIETITERLFEFTDENGTEELVMVLKPENLGQVAIKLVKENGAVSVTLSAQHAEVGRMMAERAAELSSGLENKDIEVKNVDVVDPSSAAAQMGLDFTNQGFSRRQEYSSEGSRNSYRGIQGISEDDETDTAAETENIMIREAKLWTQA